LEIINTSLNQTLGRTVVTSLTTLLVLVTLYLLGGELIRGFAVGLIIGVLVGTYSSIYIAANVMILLKISKEDLAIPIKEGADDPDMMG
jgi:preprotein translocase subunit SecF